MKKLGILVMPLMAVSFLSSCNGGGGGTPKIEIFTVTFDAGLNGKFINGEQKISFKLDSGTKLLPYIKQLLPPTLEDQTFAYYEYEGKDNAIDYDDVVTSDVTFKANYFPSSTAPTSDLTNFDWETIKKIAVTGDPSRWFNIGATKKVQLQHQTGDIYQTVRIIDFNKDKDKDGNTLGITFEFADLISDENGYSLASLWQDDEDGEDCNFDYLNSTIRKNLVGYGNDDVMWYEKDSAIQSDRKKTVLDMLPSNLRSVLKNVKKKVNLKTTGSWVETDLTDELFLLSANEMNEQTASAEVGEAYEYYKNAKPGEADSVRIKQQIKGTDGAITSGASITDNAYDSGTSYAGYNSGTAGYGGFSWLRSPSTCDSYVAWDVYDGGYLDDYGYVFYYAFAVAPAFCI